MLEEDISEGSARWHPQSLAEREKVELDQGAHPDLVIASWCGKKFSADKFRARPGFGAITAVRNGALHEIKSPLILQPGPAALTDGLAALETIIAAA